MQIVIECYICVFIVHIFKKPCIKDNYLNGYDFAVIVFMYRWYHGRLDRNVAEDRLRQVGQLGCYLIRESDRKPGSYVLSFHGKTGINHFR